MYQELTHEEKYPEFIKACKEKGIPSIIVASLGVLGDTIEEIIKNIAIAQENGKSIVIASTDTIIKKGSNL